MKLTEMTKKELYALAQKYSVKNRSTLSREQLVEALSPLFAEPAHMEKPQEQVGYQHVEQLEPLHQPYPIMPPEPEIPERYQQDIVVMMPVNPARQHVWWELTDTTVRSYREKLGIRMFRYTLKVFTAGEHGTAEKASADVSQVGSWYFDISEPGGTLWAELGITDDKGVFYAILTSARMTVPADTVSHEIDEETWMTVGTNIEAVYQLSGINQNRDTAGSMHLHEELFKHISSLSSHDLSRRNG